MPIPEVSKIRTGPEYAYHVSPEQDAPSLKQNGIRHVDGDASNESLHAYLSAVAETVDVHTPVEAREDCVFLYVNARRAVRIGDNLSSEVVFTVDVERIPHPIYVADCGIATSVQSELRKHGTTGDVKQHPAFDTAVSYWESVTEFSGLRSSWSDELLVPGKIPKDALVEYYPGKT